MSNPAPSIDSDFFSIHPAMRPGPVHYTVANLERQIAFYRDVLGFRVRWREPESAGLGVESEELLRLTEVPRARPTQGTTGLYHTAFLVPTRWELAHLLRQIAETRTPIQGMVNHRTHLAIYLPDAEGNGIELAWDFPKEEWPPLATMLRLGNLPLEPETLFDELDADPAPWKGLDERSRVGHVHLHVNDITRAAEFYHGVLGADIIFVERRIGAAFFSAGGYHHHLGTNIWQGEGAMPPPPDATGLRYFTLLLPDAEALRQVLARVEAAGLPVEATSHSLLVRDPFGIGVALAIEASNAG